MIPPINLQDEISLTLTAIELLEAHLVFDYTVVNNSPFPVYLLNSLFEKREMAGIQLDSNIVYVQLDPGPSLSLSKQFLADPVNPDLNEFEIPFISRLEPRWMMTETLRLPLPIAERHPSLAEAVSGEPVMMPHFTFTLGYIVEDQPVPLDEYLLTGGSRQSKPEYETLVTRQRLKRSPPVSAAVPACFSVQPIVAEIDR